MVTITRLSPNNINLLYNIIINCTELSTWPIYGHEDLLPWCSANYNGITALIRSEWNPITVGLRFVSGKKAGINRAKSKLPVRSQVRRRRDFKPRAYRPYRKSPKFVQTGL